jgi:uncharacterized membrane-anchored protein YhcB (DUF1043 family)
MWLLSLLPDAWLLKATTMLVGVGGIGFVIFTILGNIPGVKLSAIILKWVSLVVLCVGCYFTGAYSKDMLWRTEAEKLKADMDRKVAEADKRSKQIVTKYVTQTKVIKEKGNEIKKLSQHVKESDAKCIVPKSFVLLHDSAAKNEVPDTSKGIDGSASGVNLSTVGETISINYNNYHQLSEQLKALQDWVSSQEKIYNGK